MPLTAKGRKVLAKMKERHGKEEGTRMFYAMENSGEHKGLKNAAGGAAVYSRHEDLAKGYDESYRRPGD